MPLRRRLPDHWRITIPDEHDDFAMQALLVKLESRLTLPIEAEQGTLILQVTGLSHGPHSRVSVDTRTRE
jgi:hypothetical protein